MATKSAILILYLRLFTAHPTLRYTSYATLAVVNGGGIILTFLNLFRCHPVQAAIIVGKEGKCIDVIALYLSSAPINIITDLSILLLPLPILTSLRMEWRQKVILITTFLIGGFVTIVDIVRIAYLQTALKVDSTQSASGIGTQGHRRPNVTYHVTYSLMWSAVEVNVGLICACILVLKPLVMRILPSLLGQRRRSSGHVTTSEKSEEVVPEISHNAVPLVLEYQQPTVMVSHTGENPDLHRPFAISEGEDNGEMDFMEMLGRGPEPMDHKEANYPNPSPTLILPPLRPGHTTTQTQTMNPVSSSTDPGLLHSQGPSQRFFDFVNMSQRKGLTELTARQAWCPVLFGQYPTMIMKQAYCP
jgi:hypothetical protein